MLEDITINSSPESENQRKMIKEVLSAAVIQNSSLSLLIQKFSFLKTMRITAWCLWFINKYMIQKAMKSRLLTTEEIQDSTTTYIKSTRGAFKVDRNRGWQS